MATATVQVENALSLAGGRDQPPVTSSCTKASYPFGAAATSAIGARPVVRRSPILSSFAVSWQLQVAIAAIQLRLAELEEGERDALSSGKRAALWRAQQVAARRRCTLEDLRRYCLEALVHPRFLDVGDENDYLRGYRQGLQLVLAEIRRIETRGRR